MVPLHKKTIIVRLGTPTYVFSFRFAFPVLPAAAFAFLYTKKRDAAPAKTALAARVRLTPKFHISAVSDAACA